LNHGIRLNFTGQRQEKQNIPAHLKLRQIHKLAGYFPALSPDGLLAQAPSDTGHLFSDRLLGFVKGTQFIRSNKDSNTNVWK
jgi:hypothetical protein